MNFRERNFESEFKFKTSRSSGAGGQHVNTTETKVELIFDVPHSVLLDDKEKEKVMHKLGNYINDKGEFRISSSQSRSQHANKEDVVERFYILLQKAMKKEKKRIPTKMPVEVKETILKKKRLHSEKKASRRLRPGDFSL